MKRLNEIHEAGCQCREVGSDGTTNHTSEVVGVARYEFPYVGVTAEYCENHHINYTDWMDLGLEFASVERGR
jgi:hypothetical protein